jgi:hypothetical protein
MSPTRRVISSTEVGRKVLGSSNPMAKGFRKAKGGCADSVGGIFFGIILFMLAFWPAWCSVRGVESVSKNVDAIPLMTAAQAAGASGMVKIQDTPEDIEYISLDLECRDINEEIDVFWYTYTLKEYTEHYETQTRTETRDEGGQEVEHQYEDQVLVQDWETIDEETEVADSFMLGEIEVDPGTAQIRLENTQTCEDKGREEIGEQWLTVEYLPVDDVTQIMVVGEISGNKIRSGDPFIVTDHSPESLVSAMAGEEKGARMGLTILAIILYFVSFNLIIGPLLFLLNYVPIIGGGLRFGIGIGSLILAIVWVFLLKFIIAFWWAIILVLIILIVLLINFAKKKHHDDEPPAGTHAEPVQPPQAQPVQAPPAEPAAPEGGAGMHKCPNCGEMNDADAKFCSGCGEKFT